MLDVHQLATVRAVLAHGSFSRAAAALSLTQPAVSRQVAQLERRLAVRLVHRTHRGIRPTEAGLVLLGHAEAILTGLADAEAEMSELAGLARGTIRLVSFFTALVHLSAELAALLGERHPGLVVADTLANRSDALAKLVADEIDIALVFEHDFEPVPAPPNVEILPLFDDPVRVLLPSGHPLARRERVDLRELAGDVWIRATDGSAARLVDRVLAGAGLTPRVLLAGHGDEPIETQALVTAGKGITVAHRLNVILSPDRLASRPLAGYPGVRHVQAATLRRHQPAPVRAALRALRTLGHHRRHPTTPT